MHKMAKILVKKDMHTTILLNILSLFIYILKKLTK